KLTITKQVTNQRLSVGMTPKTLRLPKPGEMSMDHLWVLTRKPCMNQRKVECHLNQLSSKNKLHKSFCHHSRYGLLEN
ncbi:hypothetical protein D0Y65_022745, partial [Glycine soja]